MSTSFFLGFIYYAVFDKLKYLTLSLAKFWNLFYMSLQLGKSTHNQRIERLWRDLYGGCLSLFYEIFHALENQDVLRPDEERHLWCLHHVFLPIINRHLNSWKDAWVHHPLRTERNKTPMQLWISGLQEAWNSLGPEGEVFQVYLYKIIESLVCVFFYKLR